MGACGSSEEKEQDPSCILLAGTSSVGKSTILKNLMNICGYDADPQDEAVTRYEMKRMAVETLGEMMKECLKSVAPKSCKVQIEELLELVQNASAFYGAFDQEDHEGKSRRESLRVDFSDVGPVFRAASSLWKNPDMENILEDVQAWMETSPPFLQDSVVHIMSPEYFDLFQVPDFVLDQQDILLVRRTTRGSTDYKFRFNEKGPRDEKGNLTGQVLFSHDNEGAKEYPLFNMIDVGGHTSERQFWEKHYNDDLSCVIFVVALDDYSKKLPKTGKKDGMKHRMEDSLATFKGMVGHEKLHSTPFVVCLNKYDELTRKTKSKKKAYQLKKICKDFKPVAKTSKGTRLVDEAAGFIENKYKDIMAKSGRQGNIESNFIAYKSVAIDPKLTENVLIQVLGIVLMKGMQGTNIC